MLRLGTLVLTLALCAGMLSAQGKQADKQAPPVPQGPLHVVTYVDVYGNFGDDAAKLLKQFATDSLKDAGAVRFEVLRDTVRANHFAIVEVWQSRAAYESHLGLEHSRQMREKLQPWLGSPYDERLYNALP